MNKLLVTTTVIGSLLAAPALAKTQGASFGLNLINTQEKNIDYAHTAAKTSYGFDLKYAFNFGKFYVAPGIFYDANDYDEHLHVEEDGHSHYYTLDNTYGVKANIGYDVTDKFAVFGTVGHALVRINGHSDEYTNNTEEAFVYGGGIKYDLNERADVSVSYEELSLNQSNDVFNTTDKLHARYKMIKMGVGIKF